jgi:phosphotransferase system HPr-like phosphotransfer protein
MVNRSSDTNTGSIESLLEIIKEEEFLGIAQKASRKMLILASCLLDNTHKFNKKMYGILIKESTDLEDLLDDHGARNNKTWVYFGELVASIRNFANVAYIISHILRRINLYHLNSQHEQSFVADAQNILQFFNDSIIALFTSLKNEAELLSLERPSCMLTEEDVEENLVVKILPHTIDEETVHEINENITRVATEFLAVIKVSEHLMFDKKVTDKNIEKLIPAKINEDNLRHAEAKMHSLQSMYDTYIHKTPVELKDEMLKSLRGHISISLHFLEIAQGLCHFVERHETKVRAESTMKRIEKIVSRKEVLDTIINFALYYYSLFIKGGLSLAESIVAHYTVVDSIILNVPQGLGFHLRPSTLVAKVVNNYGTKTVLVVNNKEFDAASVIDMMWAAGIIKKEGITSVEFRGDKKTLQDLKMLAEVNYGEDTMGRSVPLPAEISYLR